MITEDRSSRLESRAGGPGGDAVTVQARRRGLAGLQWAGAQGGELTAAKAWLTRTLLEAERKAGHCFL